MCVNLFLLLHVQCYRMMQEQMGANDEKASISHRRASYSKNTFTEDQLISNSDPFRQFDSWFQEAVSCESIAEAHSVCLSTSTKTGKPSSRMVLMKRYEDGQFTFFSNYNSRKGRELEENSNACILFYWPPLYRQVRVEGVVKKISEDASTSYFNSRPRVSQASASASLQSSIVSSRGELEKRQREILQKYPDNSPIPKPDYWGGYTLMPNLFEFWQGQTSRLHDRIVFEKDEKTGEWRHHRLFP